MKYSYLLFFAASILSACAKDSDKAGAAGATSGAGSPAKPAMAVSSIEGFIVKAAPLSANVSAAGTLLALEETELHPEASGRVVKINLPEGSRVRKGELLLKIVDDDLQTQLRKLETQLKQAEITEQRLGELLKVKGTSQQEYDLASLQVQNLKNEMDLVRVNISKTELRAPYDGIVGLRRISMGAYVSPATAVANIRSSTSLKLDFAVPEKYSSMLHPGQTVSFSTEGSIETYSATIQATEQSIDAETRNLQVRALVKGNTSKLIPGAFADVNLTLGGNHQALLIPSQSIIPQARDKKVIVNRSGKAQFVTIKTGVRQSGMVEVTDGLKSGDTIATTGMLFLRPDAPLQFSKIE